MNGRETLLLALAASLFASAVAAQQSDFVARGNEPGWVLRMNDVGLTFHPMGGTPATISPPPAVEIVDGVEVYRSTIDGQPLKLAVAKKLCVDSMSGMPYPASVSVEVGETRSEGCGGEPESLLRGEWAVDYVNAEPVVAGSEITLTFDAGGQLSGGASCNRYFGDFTLTGEGLTISKPGATRMMCEQPLMDQEGLFLTILEMVTRFEIGPDGSLILHASDGRSVAASRKS